MRKKLNKSVSVSIQIISKQRGKYTVEQTIGSSSNEEELQKLCFLSKQEIERRLGQSQSFVSANDVQVEQIFDTLQNASIKTLVQKQFLARYITILVSMLSLKFYSGIS